MERFQAGRGAGQTRPKLARNGPPGKPGPAVLGTCVLAGMGLGVVTYAILMLLGLPILLVYGMVRGLGQSTPHGLILEVVGALLGRFFFMKRYGAMWRQYAPVLLAGFACGMGLTGMFAMGITLILKSLGRLAY